MSGASSRLGATTRATAVRTLIILSLPILGASLTLHERIAGGASFGTAAADFVVSSSRDAGPDTLRDAILAADRLSSRGHILITARRIDIETALPPLINPRGIEIEAAPGAGAIDARRQPAGAALQINSAASTIKGLHITHAHSGIVVNAPGVELTAIAVTDSKIGVLINQGAGGCSVRDAVFDADELGIMTAAGTRDVTILGSRFLGSSRAGFWLVGAPNTAGFPSRAASRTAREQVRIIDDVFEGNGSGVVIGNQSALVKRTRFVGSRQSGIVILGGSAKVEDSEFRESGTAAINVVAAREVALSRNLLVDNRGTAINIRDSEVTVESNTFRQNGFGVVVVSSSSALPSLIRDNVITGSSSDAITLIGGSAVVERNQIVQSKGAGLRTLDLVQPDGASRATPRVDANVFKANGIDRPRTGVYRVAGSP